MKDKETCPTIWSMGCPHPAGLRGSSTSAQRSNSIRKWATSLELLVPNKPITNLPRLIEGQP